MTRGPRSHSFEVNGLSNGFGLPLIYFLFLFLLACWSLANYSNGYLCRTKINDQNDVLNSYINATFNLQPPNSNGHQTITKEFIRSLFDLWSDALATGDSDVITQRYAPHATLLPTFSNEPRSDYDSIKNYFDIFLEKKPQGRIVEGFVQLGETWAQDNGIYEFIMGVDGSVVRARYTFIYQLQEDDGEWKIVHHHSSLMPES
jgi:uncharacterized protein (TIGR02246 family)